MRLLIGGSPCTYWSIAQKKNRETEATGDGWELFKNYLIVRDKFKPDYFLYENNKSMSDAIKAQITEQLGVEHILINSALVSAQNRLRLYWCGKRNRDGTYTTVKIAQPTDKGNALLEVLEKDWASKEKTYRLSKDCLKTVSNMGNLGGAECSYASEPIRIGTIENKAKNKKHDSQQYRVYSPYAKSVTLCGNGGGVGAKTGLYAVPVEYGVCADAFEVKNSQVTIGSEQYLINLKDGYYVIRKLTVRECMGLQTVPDTYEFPVSDAQAYKMLGNGWTVDVIAHLMSHFDGITTEPIDVLSMYDGMACGHIALDKLGANIRSYRATEIDKYAIKTATHNFPDIVELGDAFQVRDDGIIM